MRLARRLAVLSLQKNWAQVCSCSNKTVRKWLPRLLLCLGSQLHAPCSPQGGTFGPCLNEPVDSPWNSSRLSVVLRLSVPLTASLLGKQKGYVPESCNHQNYWLLPVAVVCMEMACPCLHARVRQAARPSAEHIPRHSRRTSAHLARGARAHPNVPGCELAAQTGAALFQVLLQQGEVCLADFAEEAWPRHMLWHDHQQSFETLR